MVILLFLFALDLSKASGDVESVKELIPGKRQIIHIRDWHLVPKESFSLDTGLTGKELDDAYAKHVEDVAAVQRSIRGLLVDVREVYVEGLSDRSLPIFQAELRTLRPFHRVVSQFDPETGPETKKILEEHKLTLLRLGAAGQLALEEKLVVLPAEGKEYESRNPVKRGKVEIDEKVNEIREDTIVRKLLKGGVLILGGAHDLSDNIKRLKLDVGYTEVTPKGYPR